MRFEMESISIEVESQATAIGVLAKFIEKQIFEDQLDGAYAAFLLALDYLGYAILLVPGRPGYDLAVLSATQGEGERPHGILQLDPRAFASATRVLDFNTPPWQQAALSAFNKVTNGQRLHVSMVTVQGMLRGTVLNGLNPISEEIGGEGEQPKEISVALFPWPSMSAFSVALGSSDSFLIQASDATAPLDLQLELAKLGYLAACGEKTPEKLAQVLTFMPGSREKFRAYAKLLTDKKLRVKKPHPRD